LCHSHRIARDVIRRDNDGVLGYFVVICKGVVLSVTPHQEWSL
jgi:hypothetical protein